MKDYPTAIRESGLSIYDEIEVGDPDLWIPSPELEEILTRAISGVSVEGMALRTRSKFMKQRICEALGYPIPPSFKKTKPRFPGQFFDTYSQKANNLQIFNEEISPTRRYVIFRIGADFRVSKVKVINGDELALYDTTGTLTKKYQASLIPQDATEELVAEVDTEILSPHTLAGATLADKVSPIDPPQHGLLLPIEEVFQRLKGAVGQKLPDAGRDQERNRGAALHELVCQLLGYTDYRDDGRFPDVRNQLLEVKLQTSPTIDLGVTLPSSTEALDIPMIAGSQIRHCDVRYAMYYATTDGREVTLTHFFLSTGESFFSRFHQMGGIEVNSKIQMHLPSDFFDG